MSISNDKRIVMTLDAGGNNLDFSAVQGGREIVEKVNIKAKSATLGESLEKIKTGFHEVKKQLPEAPVAISFAFPGPSDYSMGIIGDLQNMPTFRGGVPLAQLLEEEFKIPTFINNDGNLFVYGEAIAGLLPKVNRELEKAGSPKRFKNLFGVTLGTGFGAGLVIDNHLFIGDNSNGMEIWCTRNKKYPDCIAEESISIRAVRRVYAEKSGIALENVPEPYVIKEIALGNQEGNQKAALGSWYELAECLGDALANAITLTDALIVVGGGLSGAHDLFLQKTVEEMNAPLNKITGEPLCHTALQVFNWEDESQRKQFLKGNIKTIQAPAGEIAYDSLPRTAVGITTLGTSTAVSVGAYAFAIHQLGRK